ncbi:hypothetical protein H0H93_015679 [Arthromyces matolae]|nr:hypothetical protein H0H93_015679 [Arthromyces matolae]
MISSNRIDLTPLKVDYNGLVEYDVHNLYGTMMSTATQEAMLSRRPGKRTLVITRSTFAGAGNKVGKWLGDNLSDWPHYRISIAGMLGFATDPSTHDINLQFFYGDSILVPPNTDEDSTSVTFYLLKDIFYDFQTLAPVKGQGSTVTFNDIPFTDILLHIKGGVVLPLRSQSATTTTELRTRDFEFVVAPGTDGTASGASYIDDGVSHIQTLPIPCRFLSDMDYCPSKVASDPMLLA